MFRKDAIKWRKRYSLFNSIHIAHQLNWNNQLILYLPSQAVYKSFNPTPAWSWFCVVRLLLLCAVMPFRTRIMQRRSSGARDPATSMEQWSDLGQLQDWHPLMGVYAADACMIDSPHLSEFLSVSVCVCEVKNFKRQKGTQPTSRQAKV